ncbi:hypothetical protein GXW84_19460 [Rhodococcus sp. IEGM 248]|nr:hypothetical protein [Rhodococcus sp. IEGM 248]
MTSPETRSAADTGTRASHSRGDREGAATGRRPSTTTLTTDSATATRGNAAAGLALLETAGGAALPQDAGLKRALPPHGEPDCGCHCH